MRVSQLAAVLFDMDGLLVDTEPLWFEVETRVMAKLGGTWTAADQAANLGGSSPVVGRYMVERAGSDVNPAEVSRWLDEGMVTRVREGVRVLPGATDLLDDLRRDGVPCALVSSSVRTMVDAVLDHIGPDRFTVIVAREDVRKPKPDPEPYLVAAARLGVEPHRCVALEDSPNGVSSAHAAGCHVVAIPQQGTVIPARERVVIVPALTTLTAARLRSLVNGE